MASEGTFRQFDAVTDCTDHFYYKKKNGKQNCFTDTENKLYKKIMKEWRILEKNLPESIFVRVYEERIDLLRAVIVGAPGTPYHDGLFFFDIAFPSNYPQKPPHVHYHSRGLRLNPNLYATGYVCLSVLNTWNGTKEEKWNPSCSTILQVLVSIQGMVLNEKPYYNEPGSKPASSWQVYNEDVFALSCKTMLYMLQNPPRNFKDFVAAHFRERGDGILSACKAYRNGLVRVGFYYDKSLFSKNSIQVSPTFKKLMKKIYPSLFEAFTRSGASLQNLIEIEEPSSKKKKIVSKPEDDISKKKNSGIYDKVIGKLMCFLCLKENADIVVKTD